MDIFYFAVDHIPFGYLSHEALEVYLVSRFVLTPPDSIFCLFLYVSRTQPLQSVFHGAVRYAFGYDIIAQIS